MSLTKVTYSMISGQPANVLDFGADPTGVADSTAAIQAAIDSVLPDLPGNSWDLNGTPGGTVYIPAGKYSVSSIFVPSWINIIGAGKVSTLLSANSDSVDSVVTMGASFTASLSGTTMTVTEMINGRILVGQYIQCYQLSGLAQVTAFVSGTEGGVGVYTISSSQSLGSRFVTQPAYYTSMSGFTIMGNNHSVTGITNYASYWTLSNIEVNGCGANGFYLYSSYTGKAYDVYVFDCGTQAGDAGIYLNGIPTSGTGVNDVSFIGGAVSYCYDNVRLANGNGNQFVNMSFQSSKRNCFNFDSSIIGADTTVIRDCYFEDNCHTYAGNTFVGDFTRVTVDSCFFAGIGIHETGNKYFSGYAFNGCKITNNVFGSNNCDYFIGLVNEGATSIVFVRNIIRGNSSEIDEIPLFTPALKTIVDANLFFVGGATTNRVDHLTQYHWQINNVSEYTVTVTPQTSGTITLASDGDTGGFTRIGNLVHVQGNIVVGSVSSPVGSYIKVSLPYPVASLTEYAARGGGAVEGPSSTLFPFSYYEGNSYFIITINAASVGAGSGFIFSFSYFTA